MDVDGEFFKMQIEVMIDVVGTDKTKEITDKMLQYTIELSKTRREIEKKKNRAYLRLAVEIAD